MDREKGIDAVVPAGVETGPPDGNRLVDEDLPGRQACQADGNHLPEIRRARHVVRHAAPQGREDSLSPGHEDEGSIVTNAAPSPGRVTGIQSPPR
jgi:hypothetical protein